MLLSYEPDTYEFQFDSDEPPWDENTVQDRETNTLPQIEGSLSLRLALTQLCTEFSDIFCTKVKPELCS